ncbi:MAG TPA: isocitrate lyase/PEP mutase family protein [Candidatus Binataceae bacterium]|nr:isocitrate lyase/PEP mutase family protein [Candidatus Binataceae bacterium]
MLKAASQLRSLIREPGLVVAPGAYDCITAGLIEQAHFPAVYMTGAGTAISLGYPDYGLVTMSEMVANAGRIASAVNIPLISDADTGYGNELNVTRTVREFERAGAAAIHIEDQEFPKRCGHLDDKRIVDRDAFISKIRAAVAARRDPDFTIIARTDARAVAGLEEALIRANGAIAAGADAVFVEAPQTIEEVAEIPRRVAGPCLFNVVGAGKSPLIDFKTAETFGYKIMIVPVLLLSRAVEACESALAALRSSSAYPIAPNEQSPRDLFDRFGAKEWDRIRVRPIDKS